MALEQGSVGAIYHFSSDYFPTIREVVETICKRMGVSFDNVVDITEDRAAKDYAYLMDSQRVRKELGWRNKYTLDEGIERTIEWIDSNLEEIRNQEWDYKHKV